MYLTISKRFEISLSKRQFNPQWDTERNARYYGPYARGEHGHGYTMPSIWSSMARSIPTPA